MDPEHPQHSAVARSAAERRAPSTGQKPFGTITVVFCLTNARPGIRRGLGSPAGVSWGVQTIPLPPQRPQEFLRSGAFSDVAQGVTITTASGGAVLQPAGQRATVVAEGLPPAVTSYDVNRPPAPLAARGSRSRSATARACATATRSLSAANPDGCHLTDAEDAQVPTHRSGPQRGGHAHQCWSRC